jgi:hypothetical protein
MSFWELSDGGTAAETGKSFDAGGGSLEPIPKGTNVMASIDEAKWTEYQGIENLNVKWRVLKPAAYANRVLFQKLYLTDNDARSKDPAAKRDKARRMFAAIDSNAGGKLLKKATKPTDEELALALTNKQMVLSLGVWDMDGKTGNWVQAIHDKSAEVKEIEKPAATRKPAPISDPFDDDDDSIPY